LYGVERTVRIALGKFACLGVGTGLGSDPHLAAKAALADFASRLQSGSTPIGLPRFLRASAPEEPQVTFDLSVDDELWAILELEAVRQGATVSQLANHSVLLYLAEADRRAAGVGDAH
jgi:hypothetical protein